MAILPRVGPYLSATPVVTRYLFLTTLGVSAAYFWLAYHATTAKFVAPYITLVPGYAIFYPWTLLTSAFAEITVFELVTTLVFIPTTLRHLEKLWGTIETIKFLLVVIIIPNIIAFGFNWIEYFATSNATLFLDEMEYHGQMSIFVSILVAFTQIIPEHQVQLFGVLKTRVKNLPMAYLTLSTVMTFIGYQSPWIIIQFGWYVSWVYLRFYKKNAPDSNGVESYGDHSETFALIYWFPPFIQPYLAIPAGYVHSIFLKFGLIPSAGYDVESGGYSSQPGGARAEAERRRAIALKALDQRLANASTTTNSPASARPPASATVAPPSAASPETTGTAAQPSTAAADKLEKTES